MPLLSGPFLFVVTAAAARYGLQLLTSRQSDSTPDRASGGETIPSSDGAEANHDAHPSPSSVNLALTSLSRSEVRESSMLVAEFATDGRLRSITTIAAEAWRVRQNFRIFMEGMSRSNDVPFVFGLMPPGDAIRLQETFSQDPEAARTMLLSLMQRHVVIDSPSPQLRRYLQGPLPRQTVSVDPLSLTEIVEGTRRFVMSLNDGPRVEVDESLRIEDHGPDSSIPRHSSHPTALREIELHETHFRHDQLMERSREIVQKIEDHEAKAKRILENFSKEIKNLKGVLVPLEQKVRNLDLELELWSRALDSLQVVASQYEVGEGPFKDLMHRSRAAMAEVKQLKDRYLSEARRNLEATPSPVRPSESKEKATPSQAGKAAYDRRIREQKEKKEKKKATLTHQPNQSPDTSKASEGNQIKKIQEIQEIKDRLTSQMTEIKLRLAILNETQKKAYHVMDLLDKGYEVKTFANISIFEELDSHRKELQAAYEDSSILLKLAHPHFVNAASLMQDAHRDIQKAKTVIETIERDYDKALLEHIRRASAVVKKIDTPTLLLEAVNQMTPGLENQSRMPEFQEAFRILMSEVLSLHPGDAPRQIEDTHHETTQGLIATEHQHHEMTLTRFRETLVASGHDEAFVEGILGMVSRLMHGEVIVLGYGREINFIVSLEDMDKTLFHLVKQNPKAIKASVLSIAQAAALSLCVEQQATTSPHQLRGMLEAFEALPVNPGLLQIQEAANSAFAGALTLNTVSNAALQERARKMRQCQWGGSPLTPESIVRFMAILQLSLDPRMLRDSEEHQRNAVLQGDTSVRRASALTHSPHESYTTSLNMEMDVHSAPSESSVLLEELQAHEAKARKILGNFSKETINRAGVVVSLAQKVSNLEKELGLWSRAVDKLQGVASQLAPSYEVGQGSIKDLIQRSRAAMAEVKQHKETYLSEARRNLEATASPVGPSEIKQEATPKATPKATPSLAGKNVYELRMSEKKKEMEKEMEKKKATLPPQPNQSPDTSKASEGNKKKKTQKIQKIKDHLTSQMSEIERQLAILNETQKKAYHVMDLLDKGYEVNTLADEKIFEELDSHRKALQAAYEDSSILLKLAHPHFVDAASLMQDAHRDIQKAKTVIETITRDYNKALLEHIRRASAVVEKIDTPTLLLQDVNQMTPGLENQSRMPEFQEALRIVMSDVLSLHPGHAPRQIEDTHHETTQGLIATEHQHHEMTLARFRETLVASGHDEAFVEGILGMVSRLMHGEVIVLGYGGEINFIFSLEDMDKTLFHLVEQNPKAIKASVLSIAQAAALSLCVEQQATTSPHQLRGILEAFEALPVNPGLLQIQGAANSAFAGALTLNTVSNVALQERAREMRQCQRGGSPLTPESIVRFMAILQLSLDPRMLRDSEEHQRNAVLQGDTSVRRASALTHSPHESYTTSLNMEMDVHSAPSESSVLLEELQAHEAKARKILGNFSKETINRAGVVVSLAQKVSNLEKELGLWSSAVDRLERLQSEHAMFQAQIQEARDNITDLRQQKEDHVSRVNPDPFVPSVEHITPTQQMGEPLDERRNAMKRSGKKLSSVSHRKETSQRNDDGFAAEMAKREEKKKASHSPKGTSTTQVSEIESEFEKIQSTFLDDPRELAEGKLRELRAHLDNETSLPHVQKEKFVIKLADLNRRLKEKHQARYTEEDFKQYFESLRDDITALETDLKSMLNTSVSGELSSEQQKYLSLKRRAEEILPRFYSMRERLTGSSARTQQSHGNSFRPLTDKIKTLEANLKQVDDILKKRFDRMYSRCERLCSNKLKAVLAFQKQLGQKAVGPTLMDTPSSAEDRLTLVRQQSQALIRQTGMSQALVAQMEGLLTQFVAASDNPSEYRIVMVEEGQIMYIRPDQLTPEQVIAILRNMSQGHALFRIVPIAVAAELMEAIQLTAQNHLTLEFTKAFELLDALSSPTREETSLALLRQMLPNYPSLGELQPRAPHTDASAILAVWREEDKAHPVTRSPEEIYRLLLVALMVLLAYRGQEDELRMDHRVEVVEEEERNDLVGDERSVEDKLDKLSIMTPLPRTKIEGLGPMDPKLPPEEKVPSKKPGKQVKFQFDPEEELQTFIRVLDEIKTIYDNLKKDRTVSRKHVDGVVTLHNELRDSMMKYLNSPEKNKQDFHHLYQSVTQSIQKAETTFKDEGRLWNVIRPILNTVLRVINAFRKHVMGQPEYGMFKSATAHLADSKVIQDFKRKLHAECPLLETSNAPMAKGSGLQ